MVRSYILWFKGYKKIFFFNIRKYFLNSESSLKMECVVLVIEGVYYIIEFGKVEVI